MQDAGTVLEVLLVTGEPSALKGAHWVRREAARKRPAPHGAGPRRAAHPVTRHTRQHDTIHDGELIDAALKAWRAEGRLTASDHGKSLKTGYSATSPPLRAAGGAVAELSRTFDQGGTAARHRWPGVSDRLGLGRPADRMPGHTRVVAADQGSLNGTLTTMARGLFPGSEGAA